MTIHPTKPYRDDDFDEVARRARKGEKNPPTTSRDLGENPDEAVDNDVGEVTDDLDDDKG